MPQQAVIRGPDGKEVGVLNIPDDAPPELVKEKILAAKQRFLSQPGLAPTKPEEPAGTLDDLKTNAAGAARAAGKWAVDEGPETLGGIVGGAAGAAATPLIPFVGGTAGAAGGAALGRAASIGLREGRLPTPEDVAPAEAAGAVGEGSGRLLSGLVGKVLGGGVQRRVAAEGALVAPFGRAAEARQAGGAVAELVHPALQARKAVGRDLFAQAEQAAQGLTAEASPELTQAAAGLLEQIDGGLATAAPRARRVLEEIASATPTTDPVGIAVPPRALRFDELVRMKQALDDILPNFDARGTNQRFSTGSLNRLHGLIDETLDRATEGTPAAQPWRAAKDFWRDEVAPLRDAAGSTANLNDDQVMDALVKANRPDVIERLFLNLERTPEGQAATDQFRGTWFARAIDRASDKSTGILDARRFIDQWDRLGPETQRVLVGRRAPEVVGQIDTLRRQARGFGGANGRAFVQGATAGTAALKGAYDAYSSGDIYQPEFLGAAAAGLLPYGVDRYRQTAMGRQASHPVIDMATRAVLQALAQGQAR